MSDAKKGENHNNFGHNHNEEIRKKKNVGFLKGKTHSEESKKKISLSMPNSQKIEVFDL
jgi:hypothetical protein